MDAAQRTAIRINIFVALSETTIQVALPQNKDLDANRFENAFCIFDQRPTVEFQQGFVSAHPGTFAASQHESGYFGMHDALFHPKASRDAKQKGLLATNERE